PRSARVPYTTLFRSDEVEALVVEHLEGVLVVCPLHPDVGVAGNEDACGRAHLAYPSRITRRTLAIRDPPSQRDSAWSAHHRRSVDRKSTRLNSSHVK